MIDSLKLNINMCQICMEEKYEVKQLKHVNPVGDISSHKMCSDCYKCLKTQICPFCNGKIVKEIKKRKLLTLHKDRNEIETSAQAKPKRDEIKRKIQ
jgi:hypothetical protein